MCDCKICKRHSQFVIWLKLLPEESRPFAQKLFDTLNHTEDDLTYAMSIIDGTWPTSDDIIKSRREKIK